MQTVSLPPFLKAAFGSASVAWNGEEQGQATHRREKARAKAAVRQEERAASHAPGADGTLFYVWPQWSVSAKLLEAHNMERSHKNIVNQNSKIH